ncbi:ADP-glucose type glycogen/starch synthase [Bradyrhizobium sp. LM3.4]
MTSVRVLAVASEVYPIVKTGGLADVAGALPLALQAHGVEMRTLMPGYPDVMRMLGGADEIRRWPDYFGGPGRLLAGSHDGLDLFVLDVPHLYARPGNPYVTAEGVDWPDNGVRFAALSRIAADIGHGLVPAFVPDVVHAHDWQAGLAPAYLHYDSRPRPGTVMTIHNMAYQGKFAPELIGSIGLPWHALGIDDLEYFGGISFLKAGLQFADRVTTVSPTYAREIQSDEGGMGFGGLLRSRANVLSGILNGIDIDVWRIRRPIRTSPTASAQRISPSGPRTRRCFSSNSISIPRTRRHCSASSAACRGRRGSISCSRPFRPS